MISPQETQGLDPTARRLLKMYEKEQHASLLHEVDELSKQGPLSAGILGLTALACTAMERHDEAVKAATAALHAEPQWAWLYHALAAAESARGQVLQAVTAQARAVRLLPTVTEYPTALARYQRESGQVEAAVATASQAVTAAPDHAGARNELGLALQAAGDAGAAGEQFRRAQEAAPQEPAGYINEGVLRLRQGERAEARRLFRFALRCRPGLSEAEDRLADALASEGGPLRAAVGHVLTLGRITVVGWSMIAFLYYLLFRVLEFIWNLAPAFHPTGQVLLTATLAYLMGGLLLGRFLRVALGVGSGR